MISEKFERASAGRRFGASILNLVIGCLPVYFLNHYGEYSEVFDIAYLSWISPGSFAIFLVFIQLVFVHVFSGSPGFAISGLVVRDKNGSRPKMVKTGLRSCPYLLLFFVILFDNHIPNDSLLALIFGIMGGITIIYICISGISFFVIGATLHDTVTQTKVVWAIDRKTID